MVKTDTENEKYKGIIEVENKPKAADPNVQKYDWKTPLDELRAAAEKGNTSTETRRLLNRNRESATSGKSISAMQNALSEPVCEFTIQ
jgi:hypothetical protein